jgi:hypothetical protein
METEEGPPFGEMTKKPLFFLTISFFGVNAMLLVLSVVGEFELSHWSTSVKGLLSMDILQPHCPPAFPCMLFLYKRMSSKVVCFIAVVPAQIESMVGSATKGSWLGGIVAGGAGEAAQRDAIGVEMAALELRYVAEAQRYCDECNPCGRCQGGSNMRHC